MATINLTFDEAVRALGAVRMHLSEERTARNVATGATGDKHVQSLQLLSDKLHAAINAEGAKQKIEVENQCDEPGCTEPRYGFAMRCRRHYAGT